MPLVGLEHLRNAQRKTAVRAVDDAQYDARRDAAPRQPSLRPLAGDDPRLDLLLELWDRLDWDGRQRLLEAAEDIAGEGDD
uniref:Uncharacterized protein n=1 Tax=Schlesneria paludicola TaxID=360056 RepID=A0A7C4QLV1_9PLAN